MSQDAHESAGYVRLKHILAELALHTLARPGRARTAAALEAYARASSRGETVPLEPLAAATGTAPAGVRRVLLSTGLFAAAQCGRAVALAAPFVPAAPYFYRQVMRLGDALRRIEGPRPAGVPRQIRRAAAMFNAGLFFECHEYLEDAWRAAEEPDRTFYHGLVQAAAGCYHLEKGNLHGARTLAGKAIEKLQPFAPAYRGVDVAGLLAGLAGMRAAGVLAHARPGSRRGLRPGAVPPRLPSGRGGLPVMRLRPRRPARRARPQEPRRNPGIVL